MSRLAEHAFDAFLASLRGYYRVFAESTVAPALSPSTPVRRTGFELETTVVSRDLVADDVVALTLATGADLPEWTPGAHLDVCLPSGTQRHYSLCGDPADRRHYRIAVRLIPDGGGGSRELHEQVRAGDVLRVRGPRQAFHLVPEASYLFLAAGIGITPILPMLRSAEAAGAEWTLVYLGRSRAAMPFLDELAAYGDRVVVHEDDVHGPPDIRDLLTITKPSAAVYLCGPTPLMERARSALEVLDPAARCHSERFSAPPVRGGTPFTVRLASTGQEIAVAADESTLAALRREVPGVAYSCQQGFCGTCRLRVLEGEVEHRDRLLTEAERTDHLLTCLSRGNGTLLVDL